MKWTEAGVRTGVVLAASLLLAACGDGDAQETDAKGRP